MVGGHGGGDVSQLIFTQQDALGRPGRPARAQEDPAASGRGQLVVRPGRPGPGEPEHRKPGLPIIADQRPRLRRLQHPRHVRSGSAGIERDRYPARRHNADQSAGVAEHIRQPHRHPGAGRYPGLVQMPGPGPRGAPQPGVGQRRVAGRVLQVRGVAPAGGRLVDLLCQHTQVPF